MCAYSGGYSSGYGVNVANSTADAIPTLQDTMRIKGFAHFQNSGTGAIGQYYNYAVVTPYYGEKSVDYGMAEETGKPGYYAVTLTESNIRCELTASPFAAYHRYTFSRPGGRIVVDFENDGLYPTDSGRLRGKALDFKHKMIARICSVLDLDPFYFFQQYNVVTAEEDALLRAYRRADAATKMAVAKLLDIGGK